jgi:hypothetical protein
LGPGGPATSHRALLGTLAFALQIYFDFSGHSDMAIGLACMFGVRLPANFESPYRATGIHPKIGSSERNPLVGCNCRAYFHSIRFV